MLPFANNSLDVLVRTNIAEELQGRAWGLIGCLSQIGYVLAYSLSGLLADGMGSRLQTGVGRGSAAVIMVSGVLLGLMALAIYPIKAMRELEGVRIGEADFTIAGFLRDSQMNAMMASSKRFLVSCADYERLKSAGSEEYLIEFLLQDGADVNAFATKYTDAGLPANGPAITKPLIRMMNALSDSLMILVILLVSVVLLLISMLCIRFTLLTQLEADRKEIGMMKAIGLPKGEIRALYFLKFLALSGSGAVCGLLLAFAVKGALSAGMQELYGPSENGWMGLLAALVGAALTEGILLLSVRRTLKRTEKLSAVKRFAPLRTRSCRAVLPDGTYTALQVEQGDHTVFPVSYAKGDAPKVENKIALSYLCAEESNELSLRKALGFTGRDIKGIYFLRYLPVLLAGVLMGILSGNLLGEQLAERRITEVSGGQLRRACICRSMIIQPKILFADEPTGALNQSAAREVMAEFTRLNQEGATILMVTHDSKVAAGFGRILYFLDGCIKGEFSPAGTVGEKEREAAVSRWLAGMGW